MPRKFWIAGDQLTAADLNGNFKSGGTGADGSLSISSGTTTLSASGAAYFEKNYSSVSISGTGALALSTPSANGTITTLRSQGNVTLTSSATLLIDATAMGAAGGNPGISSLGVTITPGADGVAGGGGSSTIARSLPLTFIMSTSCAMTRALATGAGGGAGGPGVSGSGATGGRGGGAVYIECGGALNFTGAISVASVGTPSTPTGGNDQGGGGGGGGGSLLILANSITANTGSVSVSGASGGSGGLGTAGQGAGGGSGGNGASGLGSNGGAPAGTGGGAGGSGGAGFSLIAINTYFS